MPICIRPLKLYPPTHTHTPSLFFCQPSGKKEMDTDVGLLRAILFNIIQTCSKPWGSLHRQGQRMSYSPSLSVVGKHLPLALSMKLARSQTAKQTGYGLMVQTPKMHGLKGWSNKTILGQSAFLTPARPPFPFWVVSGALKPLPWGNFHMHYNLSRPPYSPFLNPCKKKNVEYERNTSSIPVVSMIHSCLLPTHLPIVKEARIACFHRHIEICPVVKIALYLGHHQEVQLACVEWLPYLVLLGHYATRFQEALKRFSLQWMMLAAPAQEWGGGEEKHQPNQE